MRQPLGPAIERMMLPLLRYVALYNDCQYESAFGYIADWLGLSDEERTRRFPSNPKILAYQAQIRQAITHLCKAGLLERIGNKRQKMVRITSEGRTVFAQHQQEINYEYLMGFESYRAWQRGEGVVRRPRSFSTDPDEQDDDEDDIEIQEQLDDQTEPEPPLNSALPDDELHESPDQSMERSYVDINSALKKQLRDKMQEMSPEAFERLVLKLMLKMGYGASSESGEHTGKRGDGGIDAIVNQDLLGLDRVGLQAKCHKHSVGPGTIREFIGALGGYSKGVLATTSNFTKEARLTAHGEQLKRIILLDGDELARLLIEHDIAVRTYRTLELKKLDVDFFEDLETESRHK